MITVVDPKTGTSTLSYHLTNVSSEDALFIGELMNLFKDPIYDGIRQQWRAGQVAITRNEFGRLKVVIVNARQKFATN